MHRGYKREPGGNPGQDSGVSQVKHSLMIPRNDTAAVSALVLPGNEKLIRLAKIDRKELYFSVLRSTRTGSWRKPVIGGHPEKA